LTGFAEMSFPNGCQALFVQRWSRTCVIGQRLEGVVRMTMPGRTNGLPFSVRCVAARITPSRVRFLPAFLSVSTSV